MNQEKFDFEIVPILTLSEDNAICNIIKIDKITLLFDCGWNELLTNNIKEKYDKYLSNLKIDAIFISNNYLSYFGALPLIMSYEINKKNPPKIYSSIPIAKLGIYVIADVYMSHLEYKENPFNFEINQASFSKIFFNLIQDVKTRENIKIYSSENEKKDSNDNKNLNNNDNHNNYNNDVIKITPHHSGFSFGGSVWNIEYKYYSFLYAPQFNIENKLITDPFSFQNFKKINFLITDTLFSQRSSIIQNKINEEFKNTLLTLISNKKNIFIPSDCINYLLELTFITEKILNEYYLKNKDEKVIYTVLLCGCCSLEIKNGVSSLKECLSYKISQQFYSTSEKPFSFKYVECVKNIDEYLKEIESDKKNINDIEINRSERRYIIIPSFENLNIGMSRCILPYVLNDENFNIIILNEIIDEKSILYFIIEQVKTYKKKSIIFEEHKVIERNPIIDYENEEKRKLLKEKNEEETKRKNEEILIEKKMKEIANKKLFNYNNNFINNNYLMFNFEKEKFSDCGILLSEKELKLYEILNNLKNENFGTSGFFRQSENENEMIFNFSNYAFPKSIQINNKQINIKCEIYFFQLFNNIDKFSKEIIINEINPVDGIIFLGNNNNEKMLNLNENIKCFYKKDNEKFNQQLENKILTLKYNFDFLNNGKKNTNYNIIYFNKIFLRVKRKNNKILDLNVCENEIYENKLNENITNDLNNNDKDCFYNKKNLKLMDIKKELELNLNDKFYIQNKKIRNKEGTIFISLNNKDLILEGEFCQSYFNIRNFIYSKYINNYKKEENYK